MLGLEWAPVAGAIVGLIVGLTGVGGGAIMAPVLLFGFGFDLVTVVATDLLFATITKLVATGVHNKNKLVDWQIVKRLWLGSIPATLGIALLANSGMLFENPWWITKLLGLLILISALSLVAGQRIQLHQRLRRISNPTQFKKVQQPATISAGFALGTLVTLTSVGAGALGAIILRAIYPLRMEPKKLIATDTTHAIPVSLLGGLSYLAMGFTNLDLLGYLLVGSIPAAFIGSHLVTHLPQSVIKIGLSAALFIASIKLLQI